MKTHLQSLLPTILLSFVCSHSVQVPGLINYQGRVAVGGVNFDGSGQFKFALVNEDVSVTHWCDDGTHGFQSLTPNHHVTAAGTAEISRMAYGVEAASSV